ncbi:hypothetical protein [Azospirillum doebereinerae]
MRGFGDEQFQRSVVLHRSPRSGGHGPGNGGTALRGAVHSPAGWRLRRQR